jgi:hypothetical protein
VLRQGAAIVSYAPNVISAGDHENDALEGLSRHRIGIAFFIPGFSLAAVSLSPLWTIHVVNGIRCTKLIGAALQCQLSMSVPGAFTDGRAFAEARRGLQ